MTEREYDVSGNKDLKKSYGEGSSRTEVLRGVRTGIEEGTICAILGPSGSGKSTLLNCIGGLETADSGEIFVDGTFLGKNEAKWLGLAVQRF